MVDGGRWKTELVLEEQMAETNISSIELDMKTEKGQRITRFKIRDEGF